MKENIGTHGELIAKCKELVAYFEDNPSCSVVVVWCDHGEVGALAAIKDSDHEDVSDALIDLGLQVDDTILERYANCEDHKTPDGPVN